MTGFWDAVASAGPYANNLHVTPDSDRLTTPTTYHSIFTGPMLFRTPNQQCQSTEVTAHREVQGISGFSHSYSVGDSGDVVFRCQYWSNL